MDAIHRNNPVNCSGGYTGKNLSLPLWHILHRIEHHVCHQNWKDGVCVSTSSRIDESFGSIPTSRRLLLRGGTSDTTVKYLPLLLDRVLALLLTRLFNVLEEQDCVDMVRPGVFLLLMG